jgi:GDP-D-mannose dehydratase
LADPTKANTKLGWKPLLSFEKLVRMMVDEDIRILKNKLTSSATDIPAARAA